MKSSRGSGAGRAGDRKKQFDLTSSGFGKQHADPDMYRVSPAARYNICIPSSAHPSSVLVLSFSCGNSPTFPNIPALVVTQATTRSFT
jgi:hypothetical protein